MRNAKNIMFLSEPCLGKNEKKSLSDVIDSNWLAMGDRVRTFERVFADLHQAKSAVAVSSGTAGLHLCLAGLEIGPGDEVLVPSLTFVATVNAVLYVGATPVFVDIEDIQKPHISIQDAEAKRTPRTKAVIIMHYGGYSAKAYPWRRFANRYGLKLIEDAAHSPGLEGVGRYSDAAVFSFFSNKNITTAEGGMILGRDASLLERIRRMRSHGMTTDTLDRDRGHAYSYDVDRLGYNYRLDELRAALGLVQIKKMFAWNEKRRALNGHYRRWLKRLTPDILIPFRDQHPTVAHLMPVVLPEKTDRMRIMRILRKAGIQSSIHYPPVHLFSFYVKRLGCVRLPRTEEFSRRELSLPLHPKLGVGDIERVVKKIMFALDHP